MTVNQFATRLRDDATRFMIAWMKHEPLHEEENYIQWFKSFIGFVNDETLERQARRRKSTKDPTSKRRMR
jgi:hypothetical protein